MFTALIIDDEPAPSEVVRDGLADAGCGHVETLGFADALARPTATDVIVAFVRREDLRALQELARRPPRVSVIAVCDERMIEPAIVAGATDCVAVPLRRTELAARIRGALRGRLEAKRRAQRERRMSDAIEALQREKHDLERRVCVDPLTGVANRRHSLDLLDAEWRRSARDQVPLGLVMLDLDCYHAYNEQYGHLGGDSCLQRVADALVHGLRRPADFIGRYGGEEFIAVLPNTDTAGARIVAERLRASVEALAIPHAASSCSSVVTITAGFASLRGSAQLTVDRLIGAADIALLRAKASGRNRVGGDAPFVRAKRFSGQRRSRYAPVFADPWFAAQIPRFLANVEESARDIIAAIAAIAGRNQTVLPIACDLKASAHALSLDTIEKLADDLVQAIERADHAALRDAASELIEYATHVQVVYRRRPTAHPEDGAAANTG